MLKNYRIAPQDMPSSMTPRSMADVLRWRASTHGDRLALTYLADGMNETVTLTYRELDARARRVAAVLQQRNQRAKSVILLFQPSPEFLVGFLACIYAGAHGVPLYPPDLKRLNRTLPRFLSIVEDCRAEVILTSREMSAMASAVVEFAPQLGDRQWIPVDDGQPQSEWLDPEVDLDEPAFLQYTSGSTGDPKGVIVTHRALLLNFQILADIFGVQPNEVTVTWLPNYHDMGLIDGWLRPIFSGASSVAMPPIAFLKRPLSWLEAISRYRAAVSGGPNFAYDLCQAKITEEQARTLDLSCWRTAYNGAEPVRSETLARFLARFSPAGFREEAACPGYGLAEATLATTSSRPWEKPLIITLKKSALENNLVVETSPEDPDSQSAVSVGCPVVETRIVDPSTGEECPENVVGELWLAGPSLASGYWNRADATRETFQARTRDGRGPFLRTGDLGFFSRGGNLFICGRAKDLIIIRGRNLYPQDVELTVEHADPATFRPGCNAAFSIEQGGEERLVIVQEVQRRVRDDQSKWQSRRLASPEIEAFAPALDQTPDLDGVLAAVRTAVNEGHGVDPYAIVLIKPGMIPKTSSGKIQRRACRQAYLSGGMEVLAQWSALQAPVKRTEEAREAPSIPLEPESLDCGKTGAEVRQWLRETLAQRLNLSVDQVDPHSPFVQLGLDSKESVVLVGDLEQWLGMQLSASLVYDFPTIHRLSAHLTGARPGSSQAPGQTLAKEPIAVVGMGCRFPGADGPERFWELLTTGGSGVREVPEDRWDREAWFSPDPTAPGKMISKWGGFLDRVDMFDPRAFDITMREGARMDPQQRLLLEVSAEALENAGIPLETCAGSATGVFIGIANMDHARRIFRDRKAIDAYFGTGVGQSIAANRISYQFDLHGPSIAVDTACSSSLVAVNLAVASLRRGECSMALAGGVNVILEPDVGITFTKAGVISRDGRCKTFDASADGIARSEGAGVVVLKPLSRALEDGDRIWALIRGGAVNSDGRSNGLMAPNGTAQEAVLKEACRDAAADPAAIQFVETHGTGTILGDPIEVGALNAVLGRNRPADAPCRLGSVKTNLGHLEAAAGVAGLMKTVLSIHHRRLVPNLHFVTPNPHIPFARIPMKVQTTLEPWPAAPGEELAGVSSFGFGGTNAHLILGGYPEVTQVPAPSGDRPSLLVLSARSAQGLAVQARNVLKLVQEQGEHLSYPALACSAALRRTHLPHRLALVARNLKQAEARLEDFLNLSPHEGLSSGRIQPEDERKVAFIFPGQGGQWHAMGRELLAADQGYREFLEGLDQLFLPMAGWSILELISQDADQSRIDDTEFTQPALFALQAGLFQLFTRRGVKPTVVVGHSMGEVTAAWAAGKLTLEEALRVILHRGRLMGSIRGGGGMAAVALSMEEARKVVDRYPGRLSIAVNNAPGSCTIAGDPDAIREVVGNLTAQNIFCRELRVEVAGHSPQMDSIMGSLKEATGPIPGRPVRVPMMSTVTTRPVDDSPLDGAYWSANLREPVRFQAVVEELLRQGVRTFLELGPHPVLQSSIQQTAAALDLEVAALYGLRRGADEQETILAALAQLFTRGIPVSLWEGEARHPHVPLPPTPWDRQRCWLEVTPESPTSREWGHGDHPLLGRLTESPMSEGAFWFDLDLNLENLPLIADHRVQELPVFPATAYLELAAAAAARVFPDFSGILTDLSFHRALIIGEKATRRLHTHLIRTREEPGKASFRIFSKSEGSEAEPWVLHASGNAQLEEPAADLRSLDLQDLRARCEATFTPEEHYSSFLSRSIDYRGSFHSVTEVRYGKGLALGTISLPEELSGEVGKYRVHPGMLDACLQVMGAALPRGEGGEEITYMPVAMEKVTLVRSPGMSAVSAATLRPDAGSRGEYWIADLDLGDEQGRIWARIQGLKVQQVDDAMAAEAGLRDWLYEVVWEEARRKPEPEEAPDNPLWLVFSDQTGLGEALIQLLRDAPTGNSTEPRGETNPAEIIRVLPGDDFSHPQVGLYTINPTSGNHLELLLEALGRPLHRAVFLWPLDAPRPDPLSPEELLAGQERSLLPIINLTRALAARKTSSSCLWLVTRGAQPVRSRGIAANQTPVWGLGRSIAHEHPELWGGLIDLDPATPTSLLLDELKNPDQEDQVAFVADQRVVPRLVPSPRTPGSDLVCRGDGTYLITGGLGSLGLHLARDLVNRGAGHLILTGRSGFPDRSRWEELASSGDPRAAILLELESLGARIHPEAADVADPEAMEQLLNQPNLPRVRGIIHAAGVVTPKRLQELTRDEVLAELAPKVAGTWNLHKLTRDLPLDFFLVFSSASAIWGSKLLSAYGAANHFMDGLIHLRREQGLAGTSINWAMWGDTGMAMEDEASTILLRMGLKPMPLAKTLAVMGRLIPTGAVQTTVADIDWSVLKPLIEQVPRRNLLKNLRVESSGSRGADPGQRSVRNLVLAGQTIEERQGLVQTFVRDQVAQVLGQSMDEIDESVSLLALGLDSLSASDLRGRLQNSLGIKVNVLSILKGGSSAQLAAEILSQLPDSRETSGPSDPAPVSQPQSIPGPDDEVLPEDISAEGAAPLVLEPPRLILLTGATGFLGIHVLAELLRQTQARVLCLAKAEDDSGARARVLDKLEDAGLLQPGWSERIQGLAGDLAGPRLGLEDSVWANLTETVDQIFHVGYLVNFLFSYEDLRAANVSGTIEVLRLASTRKIKPVHFVSSFSVLLTPEYAGAIAGEDVPLHPGDGGYREGKRACERLIKEARTRGLPISIYRPPFIGWHSESGYFNDRDFLIKLIRGSLEIGSAPDLDVVFYIAPVDYVGSALVRLAAKAETLGCTFNLLSSSRGILWKEIVDLLIQAGGELRLEPFGSWREKLNQAGPTNPLKVFFPMMSQSLPDSGSAVMELFHSSTAPSTISIANSITHLGLPPQSTRMTSSLFVPFISKLNNVKTGRTD